MSHATYEKRLQAAKEKTTLEALFRAARLANEYALSRVREQDGKGKNLRASHTSLLPHIDLEGTRISTLAERAQISKQAVSELVEELDEMGVVVRMPDPSDGRAKLVVFTKEGKKSLLDGLQILREIEADLGARIGKRKMILLRRILHEIIPLLMSPK